MKHRTLLCLLGAIFKICGGNNQNEHIAIEALLQLAKPVHKEDNYATEPEDESPITCVTKKVKKTLICPIKECNALFSTGQKRAHHINNVHHLRQRDKDFQRYIKSSMQQHIR